MLSPLSLPAENPVVTLSQPKNSLWVLELHNGADNRLTPTVVKSILAALQAVEAQWRSQVKAAHKAQSDAGGALIIVGRKDQDKFFSNGLDFEKDSNNSNFFPVLFDPMLVRILTFPIPVIAAINGHCYAGGFMLSLVCDYRIMTDGSSRNAWLCMNEVHFGAPWPHSFTAVLEGKFGDHRLHRKIALEGHRFTAPEALADGILDYIVKGNTADVLAKAEQVADQVSDNAARGVWGLIKENTYRSTLKKMRADWVLKKPEVDDAAFYAKL
ncbi:ClpP/crotonase-like domain-containing protein [Panaeolus papilionaceus]|nr:ClpP/crotonase-like domain-containing protein [Panaeolus papilionaceus]